MRFPPSSVRPPELSYNLADQLWRHNHIGALTVQNQLAHARLDIRKNLRAVGIVLVCHLDPDQIVLQKLVTLAVEHEGHARNAHVYRMVHRHML